MPVDACSTATDPYEVPGDGRSQAQRRAVALDPAYAPVDERQAADHIVFARAFAARLKFFDSSDKRDGTWAPLFGADPCVQLALAATQDVDAYRKAIQQDFAFLGDQDNAADPKALRRTLGRLFGSIGTLAAGLEGMRRQLPPDLPLAAQLTQWIRAELAPSLHAFLLYYRDGMFPVASPPDAPYIVDDRPVLPILGVSYTLAKAMRIPDGFGADWVANDSGTTHWPDYLDHLDDTARYPRTQIYGDGPTLFARTQHIATHNGFRVIFDRFLKVLAAAVTAAERALQASLTDTDRHAPHYGLFLAFLRLFEHARAQTNTLTARHLDFYYRGVLRLRARAALPGQAYLLGELARQVPVHALAEGTLLRAGKDASGKEAYLSLTRDAVLNQATVTVMQTVYRHDAEPLAERAGNHAGRLFASPVVPSADGRGAPLDPDDPTWHPFHNKRFRDGVLLDVDMPLATVGFAVASHYLLLAEGKRSIKLTFDLVGAAPMADLRDDATILLTTPQGWWETIPATFQHEKDRLQLTVVVSGAAPAITPWQADIHGGRFAAGLPVLQVLLRHRPGLAYPHAWLRRIEVRQCRLRVDVEGLKSLSVSNDFGAVDTARPFPPYGPLATAGSALVIGAHEAFQKAPDSATLHLVWKTESAPLSDVSRPTVSLDGLVQGAWENGIVTGIEVTADTIDLGKAVASTSNDASDPSTPAIYGNAARRGYIRLRLRDGFGLEDYQRTLIDSLNKKEKPPAPPVAPVLAGLTLDYASQQVVWSDAAPDAGRAHFYHVGPFGQAERYPSQANSGRVPLLPSFGFDAPLGAVDDNGGASGGDFHIGIAGLRPPQNLALLFEVAPGTADPLVAKPPSHVRWSYLRDNVWMPLTSEAVNDTTRALLVSGIVTLSVPGDATSDNSLHGTGLHWIRLSVSSQVDAVCRLRLLAPQAFRAVQTDQGNDPTYLASVLPAGTVTRLAVPDPAIRQISHPFASTGGRPAETAEDFRTRVSERLRHRGRAVMRWDIEHLVLDAFPAVHRVKCINHTHYAPDGSGHGIYRPLAPGHVTVIAVPDLRGQPLRDPLRPYASLDLLQQIEAYLNQRCPGFMQFHVHNPRFEEVRLDFSVRLRDGYDESYQLAQLRQAITRQLSPWSFAGGDGPTFSGRVTRSGLIQFVEMLPYVDYVSDFRLYHDIDGKRGTVDLSEVTGALAISMLVAAPPGRHAIAVLHPGAHGSLPESCPCQSP